MAQFFSRYGKSAFFLGLLTIITLLSAWDYPGYFSKWLSLGLPLSILNAYLLYAAVYYIIYPSCRVGKSWIRNTVYITACALLSIGFTCLISRVAISNEELLTVHNGIRKSLGAQADPNAQVGGVAELIGGSFMTFLMFFGISWALVHWHRKKNLRMRLRKWWRLQSLSTSGVHLLYVSFGWIFWIFFTLSPVLFTGKPLSWQTTLAMLVPSVIFFYINLKTSFNLLADNKVLLALLTTLCWWAVLLIIKAIWFVIITRGFGLPPILDGKNVIQEVTKVGEKHNAAYLAGKSIGMILSGSAFKELIILLASFIYGYDRRVTQYRNQMTAIAEARQQEQLKQKVMEKEVVDARLQSLKYQINPHFLFNSLNFLYSQSLPLSDELARATMLLSKMMRYGLQENSEEAKVSLAGEVEHLQNFIEFNQLRFSNQLQIDFKTEGQVAIRRIMPLLLITFVENAFKYGELHQPENPLQIHLKVDSQKLTFFVKNKKRNGPKEDSTGIGLENIRKRLALGYPEKHSLIINDEEDFYATELTVVL
ncbi:sensor histidine kinase [Dyadobacter sp. CY312]|uniref:sensor histidine kinase n=1 Tax=Dyadobacter sp. CY312 TaxID=2907303 RepID=UPI001F19AC38|nr:histidine kinase [Dyadobacter sp. CY312]MCE7040917.1 histidine kinase [Dyadobacter sp. CY312]